MKKEEILFVLEDVSKHMDSYSLQKLIEDLKYDIRLETSYKGNKKSKISAIKRVCKVQEKLRPILGGYYVDNDGLYGFTDTYHAFLINPIIMPVKRVGQQTEDEKLNGVEVIEGTYPSLDRLFSQVDVEGKRILDVEEVMYAYRLINKNDKSTLEYALGDDITVNLNYLKDIIDILGKNLEFYSINGKISPVQFKNKEGEKAIIMPIKKTK